jgi:hypothetical protein
MIENLGGPESSEDIAFLERVAKPLRSPEFVDDSFEPRLMEQVRREASSLYPPSRSATGGSWWRTERVVRISPLAGLAMAAGLVGVIALSSLAGGTKAAPAAVVAPENSTQVALSPDTVHLVRFVFVDPRASTVEIVGDFNAWTKGVTRLERSAAPGVWAASVALPAGRHEYAFIINGTRWIADPLAPRTSDDFGVESAVIQVGPAGQSST